MCLFVFVITSESKTNKHITMSEKMNEICLHCHWLYFSSIVLGFGQCDMLKYLVGFLTLCIFLCNTVDCKRGLFDEKSGLAENGWGRGRECKNVSDME